MFPTETQEILLPTLARMREFVLLGGPAMWAIAVLSTITLALILWKTWRLAMLGAWSGSKAVERALTDWAADRHDTAIASLAARHGLRARLVCAAMHADRTPGLRPEDAQAETVRVAKMLLAQARAGLRGIELAAVIGPLLGLLGTVTGMIAAFQALQEAGARADPATLAGGIWEALLTTAAGMAVAIPAQIALSWFESVIERLRHDMEDAATRVFVARPDTRPAAQPLARARHVPAQLHVAE